MKRVRGTFTVEAAVIVPVILFVFGVLLHILFYYHDKNIAMSVAHETLAIGAGREEWTKEEMEAYFSRRANGKLLLFPSVDGVVEMQEEKIQIQCSARKGLFSFQTEYVIKRTEPENYIREVRKFVKIQEEIEKK